MNLESGGTNIWSGFWARLFAWVIDVMALGIVCYGVGWLAIDYVARWGSNGRAFGLLLGVVYFGVAASGLTRGRSIGMQICSLKVLGLSGRSLGLLPAFGRALLLVGPLILNGWYFNLQDSVLTYAIGVGAITAVFGISVAQIYLLLFNRPTRRLVHDLVFRSVVVRAHVKDFTAPPVRVHAVVAAVLILAAFVLALAGPSIMRAWMPNLRSATSPEQQIIAAVNALPEITETGVLDNTTSLYSTSSAPTIQRTLVVTARVRTWPTNISQELARIGAATVKAYRFAPGQQLTVKVVFGFDLGFGSYSNSQGNQFSTACTTADIKCLAK